MKFTPSCFRKSAATVCVFKPPEMPNPRLLLPISSLDTISMVAPPTSLLPPALNALFTPTDWIMSVPKKSREIFLYSGSSEGRANPLKVVALYRSPNPRTKTFFTPSCLDTPATFVTAPSASETPLRESSLTPTDCTAMTAFCCSSNSIFSFSLFFLATTTTSASSCASVSNSRFSITSFPFSTRTLRRTSVL